MEPKRKDLTESDVGEELSEPDAKRKELMETDAKRKLLMEWDEDEEPDEDEDEERIESRLRDCCLIPDIGFLPVEMIGEPKISKVLLMETSVINRMAKKDAKRPEIMAKKARAQEARVRAINRILDIKASDPLSVLLHETVEVLVSGTQNKQLQDAFRALAFDLPEDFAHDHVYKLFPDDYVPPSCFITFQDPLSLTPHTTSFPFIYSGFRDSMNDRSDCHLFPEFTGLLGKKNDEDGEVTRLDVSYHRVARLIILLESLPSTPENAERITGLRNYVYQMLRDCVAISISKDCIGFPFAIRDWAIMDISRLEAKRDEMLKETVDGYKVGCLQNEINDIRRLIYKTKDYFLFY